MALTRILEPIMVGPVPVKNRAFRTAHGTHLADGSMTDDLIAYHAARARGGIGLTILEIMGVHRASPSQLHPWNPNLERDYTKLMKAVEPHGMVLFQQLWHGGHNHITSAVDGNPYKMEPPWSSSDVPSPAWGITPIPMTKAMIDEVVESFAKAASLCEKMGVRGAEIHAAHGYLIQQFLSPNINKREDDYGGSFDNRMRFLLEVVNAVKASVSEDFAIGVRLSPDLVDGGVGVAENQAVIERLERDKLIDFVNISYGSYHAVQRVIGGMHHPSGYQLETSVPIAQRCASVVRMVTGRFRTLEEAEQVLRESPIDMVGMTRATIADPDLVAKTLAGRAEDVRPCIGCNQGCLWGMAYEGRIGCTVNAAAGNEIALSETLISKAQRPQRVVIVGGGPAGLEAARIAAIKGHKVVLFEASPDLGGAVNIAAKCPKHHGIRDIAVWLEAEIFKLGVDVRLNSFAEADDVLAERPDVVIVATGTSPRMDGIQQLFPQAPIRNFDKFEVLSSEGLLLGTKNYAGKRAVVIDDVGHYEAIGCAEFLIEGGAEVTFVSRQRMFGHVIVGISIVTPALERLNRGGKFHLKMYHRALELRDGHATIVPSYGGPEEIIPCDLAVFVSLNYANRDLYFALEGRVPSLHLIGDAKAQRFLQTAMNEGHMTARNLN
jgi:2,4-dienoyl-CoA reductase-like NADH-dependent reductase (Old Yellow Enzyme family)/thioredoxin reductase